MASSVNRPVNDKQKEVDINTKLQLYGIYSGKFSSTTLDATQCAFVARVLSAHFSGVVTND